MLAISNSFDESCLTDEGWGRSEKYVIMKKFKIFVGKSVAFFFELMRNLSFPGSLKTYWKIVWVRVSFILLPLLVVSYNWQNVDEMNRLWETEALQHSFKYCSTLKKSHTLIIQYMYLKNKLIVDALLWCDWFPFSLSHLLYFPLFITLIHTCIQLLLAQRKDLKVRSPNLKPKTSKVYNRSL